MRRNQFIKRGGYSSLLWPALIVLLTACATGPTDTKGKPPAEFGHKDHIPHLLTTHKSKAVTPMKFMVEGKDFDVLLETKESLENGIKKFAKEYGSFSNLGDLIQKMRAKNESSSNDDKALGFTGFGGALGHEALTIIDAEAVEPGDTYNTERNVVVSLEGKIIHYKFTPDPTNPTRGNAELTVITAVSSRKYLPNGMISPNAKRVGYKWQLEVINNGFDVIGHSGNDDDPFQNTMEFSQAMKDRVKSLNFKIKLWAKGTNIIVHNVWRRESFNWNAANNNSWWGNALDEDSDEWGRLYEQTAESCIDIMFASDNPPVDLSGLGAPPYYCLGRCANPAIVNSR